MTARVLNPVALTDFGKLHTPAMRSVSGSLACGRQLNRIKKDLFGPSNPAEISRICRDTLEQQQEKASQKWGFDFRRDTPLSSAKSQYIWERIPLADVVPDVYTLTRAAHVRETPEVSSYDVLVDERSDRVNRLYLNTEDDSSDSQDESLVIFKSPPIAPVSQAVATVSSRTLRKRQPKITEYMKERKRLAQTPKKVSPSKRARTTSSSSSSTNSVLSSFRSLQRNR